MSGNKIRQLVNDADNVTFDGLDLDAGARRRPYGAVFETGGNSGVTFKNGRIGNVVDEKGALIGGQGSPAPLNVVFDNVDFHDVVQRSSDVHNECVYAMAAGLTIRNSTFRNCATMDLFVKRGDWWGQQPFGNITLENNVFGHSINGSGWHYYSLYWANDAWSQNRVVNNTFENSVILGRRRRRPVHGRVGQQHRRWLALPVRRDLPQQHRQELPQRPTRRRARRARARPPACSPSQTMTGRLDQPAESRLPPAGGFDRDQCRRRDVRAGHATGTGRRAPARRTSAPRALSQ